MNFRLSTNGFVGQKIPFDIADIYSETTDKGVHLRRIGAKPDRYLSFKQTDGRERCIGLLADRIVDVTGPATWPGLSQVVKLLRTDEAVDEWRIAVFEQCGDLYVEAAPMDDSDDEVVCACKGTTRGALRALKAQGLDRDGIGRACEAGTVCGGCGPSIDEIAGHASSLSCELVEIERLDQDIARFRFRYLSAVHLTEQAGSHVLINALVDGRWIARSYTLVSAFEGCVDVIVKREPCGLFSKWLHDFAGKDDLFLLSLPQLKPGLKSTDKTLFIAGGVGITPAFLRMDPDRPGNIDIHWSVRERRVPGLTAMVRNAARACGHTLTVRDTETEGRVHDWGSLHPPGTAAAVVICGGLNFQTSALAGLLSAGWKRDQISVESFGPQKAASAKLQHVDSFDHLHEPIVADSFHLKPTNSVRDEAYAFLRQFYFEHGAPAAFDARWAAVSAAISVTGTYHHTYEELAFGARLAWRNSARCIGRFFWKTLTVRDCRHLRTEEEMFAAIVKHLEIATRGGDILPVITVFPAGDAPVRILNPQLILYAGYDQPDGSVVGDPKNVELTRLAKRLGWVGAGGRFDVLPVMIQIGDAAPKMFELPKQAVLEVELTHPRCREFASLGLRWFAVPAVSGMALDVGGVQFTAAPSNGFYMGTEIGSLNLADPSRYNELGRVAKVMGYDTSGANPLWRDQAMLDLNVAVLHSFAKAGVRILDHHAMSDFFVKFREAEAMAQRPSYGHWAWVMPPMGGNLSPVWRDTTLQKKILKPNYFYQPTGMVENIAATCPAHRGTVSNGSQTTCSNRLSA